MPGPVDLAQGAEVAEGDLRVERPQDDRPAVCNCVRVQMTDRQVMDHLDCPFSVIARKNPILLITAGPMG
jgi:hypothetical protein